MKERREREREESKIKREEWERNAETIDRKKADEKLRGNRIKRKQECM